MCRLLKSFTALASWMILHRRPAAVEAFVIPHNHGIASPLPSLRSRCAVAVVGRCRPPLVLAASAAGTAAGGKGTAAATSDDGDNDDDEDEDRQQQCRVLLLDHLNINHERGMQDAAKAFYFDFLGCSVDPRKYENYLAGKGTVWANIGMHQFHLPEGNPKAQVFDGMVTLVHGDLEGLMDRYNDFLDGDDENNKFAPLRETEFLVGMIDDDDMMLVTDPWGTQFCILPSDDADEDRAAHVGAQPVLEGHPNSPSEGLSMEDLTVHVPHGANLEGIGRFYERVLGAPVVRDLSSSSSSENNASISIAMGERQTLTFAYHPDGPSAKVEHHRLSYDQKGEEDDASVDDEPSLPAYPSNHGPHVSLYVTNLSEAYRAAEDLGVLYVNPRFKRRAYTEDEALDQCMFRIIDIVDPLDVKRDVILKLEHEVRSAKKRDGTKYKSCPLLEV